MAKRICINLTAEQRSKLEEARAYHECMYVRERASTILKIAAGMSARQAALSSHPKPRNPDTVYAWVQRYLAEGIPGLLIRQGRGRKPAALHGIKSEK